MPSEEVLVVPYHVCAVFPDGFTPVRETATGIRELKKSELYLKQYHRFVLRDFAEGNIALKQLVAYVLVESEDRTRLFVSERKTGEKRLEGRLSFFGGHVNSQDMAGPGSPAIINAALRELDEEVSYTDDGSGLRFIGMVQDNGSSTAEHLGFVFVKTVKSAEIKETDKMTGQWMTFEELLAAYDSFESWARFILEWCFLEHLTAPHAGIVSFPEVKNE